jgi:hypothetical protein
MSKPKINEEQYAKLVNEEMQAHEKYKLGMGIRLIPGGSRNQSGLSVVGEPDIDARSIMAWAEDKVRKEYELVVTR